MNHARKQLKQVNTLTNRINTTLQYIGYILSWISQGLILYSLIIIGYQQFQKANWIWLWPIIFEIFIGFKSKKLKFRKFQFIFFMTFFFVKFLIKIKLKKKLFKIMLYWLWKGDKGQLLWDRGRNKYEILRIRVLKSKNMSKNFHRQLRMKLPNLSKTIYDKLEYQDTPKQYNKTIHISIFLICNLAISGILG